MAKTRSELDGMLDELDRDLQMLMMNSADSGDALVAFTGQAGTIEASAGAGDLAHVQERIQSILGSHGITASEYEPRATT